VPELRIAVEGRVQVRVMELRELEITGPRDDFTPEVDRIVAGVRQGRHGDPGPARALYRSFGVDPTKTRPSSEALLRRVLRGDPLPRINSLVDVANVMSLAAQVPVGLYDLGRIEGPLTIRRGAQGESYEGIRKDRVSVAGRICVADARGPFGSPTADSARTMITTDTEHALWIWFLPVTEAVLDRACELVARFGRGLPVVVPV